MLHDAPFVIEVKSAVFSSSVSKYLLFIFFFIYKESSSLILCFPGLLDYFSQQYLCLSAFVFNQRFVICYRRRGERNDGTLYSRVSFPKVCTPNIFHAHIIKNLLLHLLETYRISFSTCYNFSMSNARWDKLFAQRCLTNKEAFDWLTLMK